MIKGITPKKDVQWNRRPFRRKKFETVFEVLPDNSVPLLVVWRDTSRGAAYLFVAEKGEVNLWETFASKRGWKVSRVPVAKLGQRRVRTVMELYYNWCQERKERNEQELYERTHIWRSTY